MGGATGAISGRAPPLRRSPADGSERSLGSVGGGRSRSRRNSGRIAGLPVPNRSSAQPGQPWAMDGSPPSRLARPARPNTCLNLCGNAAHPFQNLLLTAKPNVGSIVPDRTDNGERPPRRERRTRSVWGLTATAKFPFAGLRAASSICRDDLPEPPKFKGGRAADSSGWKMFGVPIGLEIGSDLGIDDEDAGRTVPDPAAQGVEIVHGAHGRRATAIAARDGRKI